jgi:hypothetical protein
MERNQMMTASWRESPFPLYGSADGPVEMLGGTLTVSVAFELVTAPGGAAPSGASLDTDDVAGETDQDWGEGCAPFPEDCLPNGGSSRAARVVPDHFGTDWTAEITSISNRVMKVEGIT